MELIQGICLHRCLVVSIYILVFFGVTGIIREHGYTRSKSLFGSQAHEARISLRLCWVRGSVRRKPSSATQFRFSYRRKAAAQHIIHSIPSANMGTTPSKPRNPGPPRQELSLACGTCGKPALIFESYVTSGPIHELCTTHVSEMCAYLSSSSESVRCQQCAMKQREATEREARHLQQQTELNHQRELERYASLRSQKSAKSRVYAGSLGRNDSRRSNLFTRIKDTLYGEDYLTEPEDTDDEGLRRKGSRRSVRFAEEPRRQASLDSIRPEPPYGQLQQYQPPTQQQQQQQQREVQVPQLQVQTTFPSQPVQPVYQQPAANTPVYANPAPAPAQPSQPPYQPPQGQSSQIPQASPQFNSPYAPPQGQPQNPNQFNFGGGPPQQPSQPPQGQIQPLSSAQPIQIPHTPLSPEPTAIGSFPRNFSSPPPGGPTNVPPPQGLSYQPPPPQPQQSYGGQQSFRSMASNEVTYAPTHIAPETHLTMPESPLDRLRSDYEASRQRLAEVDRQRAEQEIAWAEQDRLRRESEKLARKAEKREREHQRKQELRNRPPPKDSGGQRQPRKSRSTSIPSY